MKFKDFNMCPRNLHVWLLLGVEIFINIFYSYAFGISSFSMIKTYRDIRLLQLEEILKKREISVFTIRKLFLFLPR